jgi:hypothetical protein
MKEPVPDGRIGERDIAKFFANLSCIEMKIPISHPVAIVEVYRVFGQKNREKSRWDVSQRRPVNMAVSEGSLDARSFSGFGVDDEIALTTARCLQEQGKA